MPRSLLTFSRCRVGLQGFSCAVLPYCSELNRGSVLRELGVAFRAPAIVPDSLRPSEDCRCCVRLSWDSSSCVMPLVRHVLVCVHSPRHCCLVRPAAAKRPTCSVPVVSHHLDGLLRTQVSGLLHPEARWSSLRFRAATHPHHRPKSTVWINGAHSRNAVHTLRRIPLVGSRTASLRPLPS